jgi:trk system potassium uptake protein TrkA
MTGTVVVVGAGRVGFRTAEMFQERGYDVRIVERDPERCDQLRGYSDLDVVQGDATQPDVLERALVGEIEAFGALTEDGEVNLTACLLARELAPEARFVARVRRDPGEAYARFFDDLTLVAASSVAAAANAMGADATTAVREHVGGLEVFELTVAEEAPAAGRPLSRAELPEGCLVVCRVGGDRRARGGTVLEPGEAFVVAVEPNDVAAARTAFGVDE